MSEFHTKSHPWKNMRVVLYVYIAFALLSLFGLKIALITCLFFEGMSLTCSLICLLLVSKTYWNLDFYEDRLVLTNNANKQEYIVHDIPASDFIFKQNKNQTKKNRCDVVIKGTSFCIYDVDNYEELKKYVESAYRK